MSELLVQETVLCQELSSLLEQENQALRNKDREALEETNQKKPGLLAQITALETQRMELLFNDGSKDIDAYLEKQNSAQLNQQWDELQSIAADCSKQNEVNGVILAEGQQVIQQALNILRGQEPSGNTYSPDGELSQGGSGKSLGEA